MKTKRYFYVLIPVSLIIAFALYFGGLFLFLYLDNEFVSSRLTLTCPSSYYDINDPTKIINGEPDKINNEDYSLDNIKTVTCQFGLIFPSSLESSFSNIFTYGEYCKTDGGSIIRGEVYLYCVYSKNVYDSEIQRLTNLYDKKNIVSSNNLFYCEAFISIYNDDSRFEYAICDNANLSITYIYFNSIDKLENLVFGDEFKPTKVLRDSDIDSSLYKRGSFSIYSY